MDFSLTPPLNLPNLCIDIQWQSKKGLPLSGQACAHGLAKTPILTSSPHPDLKENRWLVDHPPYSWARDNGFEDDIITPAPKIHKGKAENGKTPLLAIFADKTTMAGWEYKTIRYWCPFPLIAFQAPNENELTTAVKRISQTINAMPELSQDQRILTKGKTLRPYMVIGHPLLDNKSKTVISSLAFLRYLLLTNLPQSDTRLATLTLTGRTIHVDQTWGPITLSMNGLKENEKKTLAPLLQDLTQTIMSLPILLNLTQSDLCYSQRVLFVSGGQLLAKADEQTPFPSSHEQISLYRDLHQTCPLLAPALEAANKG